MQKACIVIPCYNEASRLQLAEFEVCIKTNDLITFLFVNDGSTDQTAQMLKSFSEKYPLRVGFLSLDKNGGKAEAVRQGILFAGKKHPGSFLGFWDADLATPLGEIPTFLDAIISTKKNIVIGSRVKRLGATVERKISRHLLGRVFSTFASIILKMPVYDTQCGSKIFSPELTTLFEKEFITKWLFDIELLARYRNQVGLQVSLDTLLELPVGSWHEKGGSKLKLSHMLKVPFDLLKIHKTYN